jgi:hypothetical protein
MDGSADAAFLPGLVFGIEKTAEKRGSGDAHIHAHTTCARAQTHTHTQPGNDLQRCQALCVSGSSECRFSERYVARIHRSHAHTPLNL